MSEESRKVGRPTKYKEEYAEQAYRLSLLGMTDVQIAGFFEVHESTVYQWKIDYPEFSESIKRGKEIADIEVVEALRKRAIGYTYEEVKEEDSPMGVRRTTTVKEVVPDPVSIIFWLRNRHPDKWSNNPMPDTDDLTATPVQIVVNVQDARKDDKPEP
ncbi:helix-turn-helix domain-containing protein [Ignatzschineria rhizosphaerae]|uniref:Helix-turn-helix domain-containing protein n=1 Tax=Ignatzschineria rhizosphaerae TaxID=2923279 RepID=A0ABY3X3A7_9GAMM|nr:helix-turn-helix domain-containing protein [Ignatzschineria rhizosphaerae]UNM95942.1 helix-turn-helix domain-containing protein [Ignatzschineria rhizosphaerae]